MQTEYSERHGSPAGENCRPLLLAPPLGELPQAEGVPLLVSPFGGAVTANAVTERVSPE